MPCFCLLTRHTHTKFDRSDLFSRTRPQTGSIYLFRQQTSRIVSQTCEVWHGSRYLGVSSLTPSRDVMYNYMPPGPLSRCRYAVRCRVIGGERRCNGGVTAVGVGVTSAHDIRRTATA